MPGLERLDWSAIKNLGNVWESGFFPDNYPFEFWKAGFDEKFAPGKLRRERFQFGNRHCVIGRNWVSLLSLGPACICDLGFKINNSDGAFLGIGPAQQTKQLGDVGLILLLLLGEIGLQVVIAVRQSESRLPKVNGVMLWIFDIHIDSDAEDPAVKIRVLSAHQGSQCLSCFRRLHLIY